MHTPSLVYFFEAASPDSTDQRCDGYAYWRNGGVKTKQVNNVSIKRTYFYYEQNSEFCHTEYLLQNKIENTYRGLTCIQNLNLWF